MNARIAEAAEAKVAAVTVWKRVGAAWLKMDVAVKIAKRKRRKQRRRCPCGSGKVEQVAVVEKKMAVEPYLA